MIALAGLFLTGVSEFTGIALGTIAVVGVAMIGSLTFLPALLSWLGPWADRARVPFLGRRRTAARPSRLWAALVRRVIRHPAAWGLVAALAMLALAAPALGLRLGNPVDGGFSSKIPIVATYDRISRAFPGGPAPAEVVVTGHDLARPQVTRALSALRDAASADGPIRGPIQAESVARGQAVLVSVPLAGNGTDAVSNQALLDLRNHVLPETLGRVPGVSFAVAGNTAESYDDIGVLRGRTPLVLAVVAVLAFLLLLLAFRSVLIPLISVSLTMLSVSAAFGLLTLVFQDGHLAGPLGFTSYGAIVPWVPLFVFVFLFGLSMDYHVFILSRIRELRGRGASTADAVVGGIASSAGVVTSAALIMMAVFSIFATLELVSLKMLGVTLTAAVLIDATVVRGILLPACLALLGERSWYLPRWLRWLPGRPVVPFGPARRRCRDRAHPGNGWACHQAGLDPPGGGPGAGTRPGPAIWRDRAWSWPGLGRGRVVPLEPRPERLPDGGFALRRDPGGVEGMEHDLDAVLDVLPVQLGVAVVGADLGAAADPVDGPDTEMGAGAVVGQVPGPLVRVTGAEPLVVAVGDLPGVADDVQAVVRLAAAGEPVCRSGDHPDPEPARVVHHLGGGVLELLPAEAVEGREVGSGVAGERSFWEVGDPCSALAGQVHLALDVAQVGGDAGADRELAGGDREHGHAP